MTVMAWRKSSWSNFNGSCVEVAGWRKSSRSTYNGDCIEARSGHAVVGVRDTADREGPVLTFSAAAWREFAGRVKRNEGAAY